MNNENAFPEIPGFRILDLLGEGAMARVFLAEDEALDRRVAIKVMTRSLAIDPSFRDRFLAEARDTAKFVHPGIVSIYSTGVHDGNYYLVLEYLEAGTLKDRQRARQQFIEESGGQGEVHFSAQESLVLLAQIADALAYLHSKNVIHRDIKPANILFRADGTAVLSDLGIAKSVADNRELTQTGFAVGTPAYMSPEQKMGAADLDGRSDLYSLGVVFFELLTGRKPFRSASGRYEELRKEQAAAVPVLPDDLAYLQPLLNGLLASDRNERFNTAGELARSIRQFTGTAGSYQSDATVIQRSTGPRPAPGQAPARKRLVIAGILATVLVTAVTYFAAGYLRQPEAPAQEPIDGETAALIEGLRLSAESHMEEGDYVSGCPSCAWEVYDRIERLQRGNPDAAAGKATIRRDTLEQIRSQIELGNTADALALIDAGEFYFKDYADTLGELAGLREQAGQ
ncbi:MAG: serine/threonine-protein kinase [Lysobacterales bacterium]